MRSILGMGGQLAEWEASHRRLVALCGLMRERTPVRAVRSADRVLVELGYVAFLLLRRIDERWVVVTRSAGTNCAGLTCRLPTVRLEDRFPPERCTAIDVVRRREPCVGLGTRAVCICAADSVTAIYDPPVVRDGRLAMLVFGAGAPARGADGAAFPLLRLVMAGLGHRFPKAPNPAVTVLPDGEAAVLAAFANGASPAEIASARGTSVRTVRNQMENARRRLGARSNAHAVALAIRTGAVASHLIEPVPADSGEDPPSARPGTSPLQSPI